MGDGIKYRGNRGSANPSSAGKMALK